MTRFLFRFQSVLDLKKKLEEAREREFSKALAFLRREEGHLLALRVREEEERELLASKLQGRLNLLDALTSHSFLRGLSFQIKEQHSKVKNAEEATEKAREDLVNALKERKKFENLRESDRKRFQSWVRREEEKFLDEVTMSGTYPSRKERKVQMRKEVKS